MFTVGSFAIIVNEEGKVLLAQRKDNGKWNLPGGRVESLESPWATVVRETEEEVGLKVEVKSLLGVYTKDYMDDLVFQYECRVIGGSTRLSEEARDIKFFSLSEMPLNMSENHLERIKDFFSEVDQPIMKVQTKE